MHVQTPGESGLDKGVKSGSRTPRDCVTRTLAHNRFPVEQSPNEVHLAPSIGIRTEFRSIQYRFGVLVRALAFVRVRAIVIVSRISNFRSNRCGGSAPVADERRLRGAPAQSQIVRET